MRVFDFFSGCGGTSLGFRQFGYEIIGGLDYDKDSAETFQQNFRPSVFFEGDIRKFSPKDISGISKNRRRTTPLLFCGCAPCQPFSTQGRNNFKTDKRGTLLTEFYKFVEYWLPEGIFIENVPGLQKLTAKNGMFPRFIKNLNDLGYQTEWLIVNASSFGVPQSRSRLLIIGTRNGEKLPPLSKVNNLNIRQKTVRDAISDLPPLKAGESYSKIPNHVAAKLSKENLVRIKSTPEGGDRRNWPTRLKVDCHVSYVSADTSPFLR